MRIVIGLALGLLAGVPIVCIVRMVFDGRRGRG